MLVNSTEARVALTDAYKEASGINWRQDDSRLRREFSQVGFLEKIRRIMTDQIPGGKAAHNVREWKGMQRLYQAINDVTAIYPRSDISFEIDEYGNKRYVYDLYFKGENIGQEPGMVKLPYESDTITLRRGTSSAVEIERKGERTLHIRYGEGIYIKAMLHDNAPMGMTVSGRLTTLATWIPDLSDIPQSFHGPNKGQILWHAPVR